VSLPQLKSNEYADDVVDFQTTELRLRKIIKDLEQELKSRPNDSDALMVLGMALCRIGRLDDGIRKMKYSVGLNPMSSNFDNLFISLKKNGQYEEAWDVVKHHSLEVSLFDAVLCHDYERITGVFDADFQESLTEISRMILNATPYGSCYEIEIDEEDGQKIVGIQVGIPASVESVFAMYCELTQDMAKNFSSDVLMRVIPMFSSVL